MSIEQLRERMPVLRQRQQTLRAELQAIADQTNDRATFMRLAETLTAFLARLRSERPARKPERIPSLITNDANQLPRVVAARERSWEQKRFLPHPA